MIGDRPVFGEDRVTAYARAQWDKLEQDQKDSYVYFGRYFNVWRNTVAGQFIASLDGEMNEYEKLCEEKIKAGAK